MFRVKNNIALLLGKLFFKREILNNHHDFKLSRNKKHLQNSFGVQGACITQNR